MKKKIALILILVIAAATAFVLLRRSGNGATARPLGGNVDIREVNVSFRVGGRLLSLTVDEGDAVKQGQVLGQLDRQPLENALHLAQAQLAGAKAQLTLLENGYRAQEIEQAAAVLAGRQAVLKNALIEYDRYVNLLKDNAISQRDVDISLAARDKARADVEEASQQYTLLKIGYRTEEIEQARAQVQAAKAQVDTIELQLSDTTLKAPSDGVILTRAVEPGTLLSAGATVFSVSLTNPVWVRAYVAEPDLGAAIPGREVTFHTDSRPDHIYRGTIGFVSPTAEFTPKTVETQDLRTSQVYRLRIVVQNPDEALRQGMPVTVLLPLHQ